jgi:N-methylhydantoinase A
LRRALGSDVPVVASHEILPVYREFERASTTSAEAYLRPRVGAYLARTAGEAQRRGIGAVQIMTSSGGALAPGAATARASSLALSGPAGGVVGARLVGEALGIPDLLTLDMGGTSADASIVSGGEALFESAGAVGGVPLGLPAVLIETVSAGGGSIAWNDEGGALKVGPRSAGAVPGPACYGRGGAEPTVTDACLALGWLDPGHPLAAEVQLDRAAAEAALQTLARGTGRDVAGVAAGVVDVATAVMARALKRVSVGRGADPRAMTLLPFGGAGPLFACALADALGMRRVVVPPHPGVLSALGLAASTERIDLVASWHRRLDSLDRATLHAAFAPLLERAARELSGAVARRLADCRFAGQGYELTVAVDGDVATLQRAFLAAHQLRYGFRGGAPIEVVNLRVVAERATPLPDFLKRRSPAADRAPRPSQRALLVHGKRVEAEVWPLEGLPVGRTIRGPAVFAGQDATALLEPGWTATVHDSGALLLERR